MTENNNDAANDNAARIQDLLAQHGLDWHAVAEHAKQRDRASKVKRTRLLRTLKNAAQTMAEVGDDLTPEELAQAQDSLVELARALDGLAKEPEEALLPPASPEPMT